MPVIRNDPNEAICPDFASEDYQDAREALIRDGIDDATATVMLTQTWNASNRVERTIWARQVEAEETAAAEAERQMQATQARQEEARSHEDETSRAEERKKHRTKYIEIPEVPPPSTPPEILSAYATTRLQKGNYVELWYFTNDGLDHALKNSATLDESAMVQTFDKEGRATWVSAAASREARSAVDDRNLTWEEVQIAVPRFLDAIHAAGWTRQRQVMMTNLFTRLQMHPLRSTKDPLDRRGLLRYLSEQRRLWHSAIDTPGGAWDIGTLSEMLIRAAVDAVTKEDRARRDAERTYLIPPFSSHHHCKCDIRIFMRHHLRHRHLHATYTLRIFMRPYLYAVYTLRIFMRPYLYAVYTLRIFMRPYLYAVSWPLTSSCARIFMRLALVASSCGPIFMWLDEPPPCRIFMRAYPMRNGHSLRNRWQNSPPHRLDVSSEAGHVVPGHHSGAFQARAVAAPSLLHTAGMRAVDAGAKAGGAVVRSRAVPFHRERGVFVEAQGKGRWQPAPSASVVTRIQSSGARPNAPGTTASTPSPAASTGCSPCETAAQYARTGNGKRAAPPLTTTPSTSARAVAPTLMELKIAIELRGRRARCPYPPDVWHSQLSGAGLLEKYPHLPRGFSFGFKFNFPSILATQSPPNSTTVVEFASEFRTIVDAEISKGRYIGPFSRRQLEETIGPFQTSPFSIIPKPNKPGKFRIIQNLSFPHSPSSAFPNPSINSFTNSNDFPCTWGTFSVICLLISRLPPGSQAAVRDVAEAYRTIPLHPSQWPAAVARVGDDEFCVDTSLCFGASPSSGGYGCPADAGLDIMRYRGMGPLSKWVDDHLFLRIPCRHLPAYNELRRQWHADIVMRGEHRSGGRLWYGGGTFDDGSLEEFDEDCRFPLQDLSAASPRSSLDAQFTYSMEDVDRTSDLLGIPWEKSKDKPFASVNTFIGLSWDLEALSVSLGEGKVEKYLAAIEEWRARPTHDLRDVQKLYGKLLHASLVYPAGRAYLTSLETMLRGGGDRPFVPHHPPRGLSPDLDWWSATLRSARRRPIPRPVLLSDVGAFSDASSGIGVAIVIGGFWRAWRLVPGWQTLDGKRDIQWAEAIGFELLIHALVATSDPEDHHRVYGDNQGVVEGWWNGRSRNSAVNNVFRRLHGFLEGESRTGKFHSAYVPSAYNPADAPSRGKFLPQHLLLPPLGLPEGLDRFLVDATRPYTPTELRLLREGRYPPAAARVINTSLRDARAREHFNNERFREERSIDDVDWSA